MGFEGSHWVDMVGGIILGVVFGIEPQHKSLWRRSPTVLFFQEKACSCISRTCFRETIDKMQEQTSNNIPIPRPAAFLFEKSGRPACQPTMYLDPPIHFGSIFIGIGILLDIFSLSWMVFSLLWLVFPLFSV